MKSLRSKNRKPTHPGAILREDVLPVLGMSQAKIAKTLKVSRYAISQIIRECKPVTPDIAIRLARFLGGTPDSWLNMQQNFGYALHQAQIGKKHPSAKPLKGFGSAGVLEVVENAVGPRIREDDGGESLLSKWVGYIALPL